MVRVLGFGLALGSVKVTVTPNYRIRSRIEQSWGELERERVHYDAQVTIECLFDGRSLSDAHSAVLFDGRSLSDQ